MTDQRDAGPDRPAVVDRLTAKQREAVRAATEAGFFKRPQQATADEIADDLGLSRSTFLYHLRNAEQTVFAAVLNLDS